MKKIFLVASLSFLVSASFAQKKAVKDAKASLEKKSFAEARDLIKPALINPETATEAETWKVVGDIEFKVADNEIDNERVKELKNTKGWDEKVLYQAMYNLYQPYLKADSLGEIPDTKGKIKNKVRKDIVKNFKILHQYYPSAGIFYNGKGDMSQASKMFEIYWNIPSLPMFTSADVKDLNIVDSTFQVIKYYAAITAIQAKETERSIILLKRLINEPYIQNSSQKESDPYELLASQYLTKGDSIQYLEVLNIGVQRFPQNQYFQTNLLSFYLTKGQLDKALEYIDRAIANSNTPQDKSVFLCVKASLYVEKKDYKTAEAIYDEAFKFDNESFRAFEGKGLIYVLRAQDMREESSSLPRKEQIEKDKKTASLYLESIPYFTKLYDLQKAKNESPSVIKKTLLKLQNVYYNLSFLNVDKKSELDKVNSELETLKYD